MIKMALVYEKVKEEDWDLYNSFLPNIETADEYTKWVVDREKNIYSFWVGGDYRDYTKIYFMSWNNINIFIYTKSWSVVGEGIHMWINKVLINKKGISNDMSFFVLKFCKGRICFFETHFFVKLFCIFILI